MMTMSRALSAGQATNYYQKEFTNAKENYYSESGEVRGRWSGRLAEEWELNGEVQSEQYERLVAGGGHHTRQENTSRVQTRGKDKGIGGEVGTTKKKSGGGGTTKE